jgi:hypothetical protein
MFRRLETSLRAHIGPGAAFPAAWLPRLIATGSTDSPLQARLSLEAGMNIFARCALGIGLAWLGCTVAVATPSMTVIQDVLYNADGTHFNGLVTISWQTFEAVDMSNIPANSFSTQIVNGLLRVKLVPTTNALSPAGYTVVYNSDGYTIQFTENWAVPPSNIPLPVSAVRVSGSGAIIGGGGSGNLENIGIPDVTGLAAALSLRPTMGAGYTNSRAAVIDASGALNGATGNLTDCLHVDGTSGPCGGGSGDGQGTMSFVDGETPSGAANGVNPSFGLAGVPTPSTSLSLYRNGLLLRQGLDFSVSNNTVTFVPSALPQPNDVLTASYRINVTLTGVTFIDAEVPAGTVDGVNTSFTLAQAPTPVASLALFRNGIRLKTDLDFTISGGGIVFRAGLAPQPGDVLVASYRVGVL